MDADVNHVYPAVIAIAKQYGCPLRLKPVADAASNWSPWAIVPSPGYLETAGCGPLRFHDIEHVDVRVRWESRPAKHALPILEDRRREVVNALAARGVAPVVVDDESVVRVRPSTSANR